MSDPQDIREWAKSNGIDLAERGRLPKSVVEQYEARDDGPPDDDGPDAVDGEPMVITADPEPAAVEAAPVPAERRPQPAPRQRGLFTRKPRTSKPAAKRVSIENIVSSGWGLAAMALMRSPGAVPVGRVMQMQAPVAGTIGEDLLRGTVVDRVLQPLARGGKKAELGMALAGPPLLVGIMTAKPELFPVLRPMLKMSMMSWMEISAPAVEKAQRKAERWAEKFGDVDLDGMIDSLWQDVPVPSEAEEEAIRRARGE